MILGHFFFNFQIFQTFGNLEIDFCIYVSIAAQIFIVQG